MPELRRETQHPDSDREGNQTVNTPSCTLPHAGVAHARLFMAFK